MVRVRGGAAGRRWFGDEDPDEVVMLFTGIAAGIDAINLQLVIRGERRNELALAGVSVKPPAVIAAFHLLAVKVSLGKRHAAVRTSIM